MSNMAATVKLFWVNSPSPDIVSQKVSVSIDSKPPTVAEFGPEVNSLTLNVAAKSSVLFTVEVTDSEGQTAMSESYFFQLGDLVAPMPATGLGHEVLGVMEVDINPLPI